MMATVEPPVEIFCPECGYDLRAIPEGCCPECGFRYDQRAIRSLNRHWHLNRLGELQEAVAAQSVAILAAVVLLISPGRLGAGFAAFGAITVWVVLRLTAWRLDVSSPGAASDLGTQFGRNVAFWLACLLVVLILIGFHDCPREVPGVLMLIFGGAFGLIARRRMSRGRSVHRGVRISTALSNELRGWNRANTTLLIMSAMVFVLLGFSGV